MESPNLLALMKHLQNVTADNMSDIGIRIRRPKKKRNILVQNEACIKGGIQRFDSGAYTRMQFLRAMSHSLGAHTDALKFAPGTSDDDDDDIDAAPAEPAHTSSSATFISAADEDVSTSTQPSVTNAAELCDVCLIAPRSGVALMSCGHSGFCGNCADTFRDGQRLPTLSHTELDGAACF